MSEGAAVVVIPICTYDRILACLISLLARLILRLGLGMIAVVSKACYFLLPQQNYGNLSPFYKEHTNTI
jgi:hypothetical protein